MRRGSRAVWLALLVSVVGACALWVLPARWVMAWIPDSSPIAVTDASGTLWNASASLAIGVPGLRRSLPDPVHWKLALSGGPHLVFTHPWLRGPLIMSFSWRGLRLSGQSLQLPATALTTLHSLFNTVAPGGELHLQWPDLIVMPGSVNSSKKGTALLIAHWRNASSSLTRIRPMGNYTLTLTQEAGQDIALALNTDRGPLMMQGTGTLRLSGAGQFDGRAWVDPSFADHTHTALRGLLDAMGPRTGQDGHVVLRIR